MRMSAWRGEPFARMPNRSTSKRGVRVAMISMSQALHAPLLKMVIQGDFRRAHEARRWERDMSVLLVISRPP
jgi:hypothetical protein